MLSLEARVIWGEKAEAQFNKELISALQARNLAAFLAERYINCQPPILTCGPRAWKNYMISCSVFDGLGSKAGSNHTRMRARLPY
jgi:hypothetical protein